jgi:hypothetical protein
MQRLGSANGSSRSAVTGARIWASAPCMRPRYSWQTTSWWFFRRLTERAPPQTQLIPCSAGNSLRGKPGLRQGGGQSLHGLTRAQPLVGGWLHGEVAPPLAAGLRGGLTRLGHHARDEAGEHLGEQPVAPPPRGPAALHGAVCHAGPARRRPWLRRPRRQARVHQRPGGSGPCWGAGPPARRPASPRRAAGRARESGSGRAKGSRQA